MTKIKIARYAVIPSSDSNRLIPDDRGINDIHFRDIQAPGVDAGFHTILLFKMQVRQADLTLQLRLNSTVIVRRDFVPGNACSFHEIVAPGVLKEANNELTVAVTGVGKMVISDIVLLFQANIDIGPVLSG